MSELYTCLPEHTFTWAETEGSVEPLSKYKQKEMMRNVSCVTD